MSVESLALPVVVKPTQFDVSVVVGPGRILHKGYLAGGRYIGKHANHLAHRMGYGPDAASQWIAAQFGDQENRLTRLADLRRTTAVDLEEKCLKLTSYALP